MKPPRDLASIQNQGVHRTAGRQFRRAAGSLRIFRGWDEPLWVFTGRRLRSEFDHSDPKINTSSSLARITAESVEKGTN